MKRILTGKCKATSASDQSKRYRQMHASTSEGHSRRRRRGIGGLSCSVSWIFFLI
jgi:hypothetical protein